jgi:hypothetical protein
MAIYGRSGLPDWNSGTATATNGSAAVTFAGANLIGTDPTTGASLYAAGRGDLFVVQGVGAKVISSVDSVNGLTLVEPWSYATQANVAYAIVRMSFPQTGAVAKALTDLYAMGTDANPELSLTIDDSTARLKLKNLAGVPTLAVGATGTTDGSLVPALQATPAGLVSFPQGAYAAADWNNNRIINGDFSVWQTGTSFSIANNTFAYTADQWIILNNATGVSLTVSKVTTISPSFNNISITGTAAASGSSIALVQRFESTPLRDLGGATVAVSFTCNASTSAGTLTGYVQFAANTSIDNGTFTAYNPAVTFTVPTGTGRVSVILPPAATANIQRGAQLLITFVQNTAAGNVSIVIAGVVLEKGAVANPWAPKPPAREMADCQRFFSCSWPNNGSAASDGTPVWFTTVNTYANQGYVPVGEISFPVQMRARPTLIIYDDLGAAGNAAFNFTNGQSASGGATTAVKFNSIYNNSGSSVTAGTSVQFHWSANARL